MTRGGRRHFGSVRKLPSGRWQASYWHEGLRQVAPETFRTRADAVAHLSGVETDLRRGAWIDPSAGKVSVADYAERWIAQRAESRGLAERTVELYRWLLAHYIAPYLGDVELAALKPTLVREWHAAIAKDHPTTAAKSYRLLAAMARTAATDGLIVKSPCRVEGAAVERAPERPVASIAEVSAVAEAMPEHLRIAVLLAAWCQLRRGELLGLRRGDIDLEAALLHVRETRVTLQRGRVVTKAPKTKAGRRTIAIPPNVLPALVAHLDGFVGPDADALLLSGEKGGPLRVHVLQTAWDRARTRTGLGHLRLHDLRHSGLTWAAASGASVAELMRRAGHASADAALRYQHATDDRDRVIAAALGKLAEAGRAGGGDLP